VGHFPIHTTTDGESIAVDLIDRDAVDPAMQAADRDECRRAVDQIPTVVATGVALTAVFGFDQGEAATQMGISRPYLSRTMKKSEREMQRETKPAA
jgi:DNA-directed RNA polymerase specialized sigma24 family protein